MLSAHYRSPLNFSAELVEASKNGLERILTAVDHLNHLLEGKEESEITEKEKELLVSAKEYGSKFEMAMEDDFNTADAISVVFELVKFINTNSDGGNSAFYLQKLKAMLLQYCDILGIIAEREKGLLAEDVEALIAERQQARKEKNFARADEIRKELLEQGIVLEDTREGVKWKRV